MAWLNIAKIYLLSMLSGQTRKGWHVLNQQKSKYYLVDVLSQSADGEKTKVRFHGQNYQILTSELLPYQHDKPNKLQDLAYPNKPEIMEWLSLKGEEERWVKINSRVVLDFNVNTQRQRMEHVKYLLGRFLISFKKKQYLLIANEPIRECFEHTIHQILVRTLPEIVYLWPYAISLTTLNFIYKILFAQLPIKFKIYIKQSSIIRISIIPYNCQSKDLMGWMSESSYEILALKSPIFAVINGSPREMRKYYRVPDRVTGAKSQYNINNLVDSLIEIGCKVGEINELIGLFTVILSINQLQLHKGKKQNRTYFRLRQGSQTKDSLTYWLGQQLTSMLQQDLNCKKDSDNELKDIKIRQYVLIKLIWQQTIRFTANLINSKMFNFNAPFTPDVRQFIFIEFPALGTSFQQDLYNQKLLQINQHIKEVALKIKKPVKVQTLDDEKIESKIREEYGYDINKDIIKELEKRRMWESQLSEGQFMTAFKRRKLKLSEAQQQQNAKKSNLNHLFQQIASLYKNDDSIFANFIIRSEMNNNMPRKELLDSLQLSIEEKRRQQKDKEDEDANHNQNQDYQDEDDCDWIQLLLTKFEQRYKYTQMAKYFYHKKLTTFEGLENYFEQNRHEGKIRVIKQKEIVFLSYQKYRELEEERSVHDIKSDKIKKQLKRQKYRRQFLRSVHKTCLQIRFIKQLVNKLKPSVKQPYDDIKTHVAINKMQNIVSIAAVQSQQTGWKAIKKRAAIKAMQIFSKAVEGNSAPNLQKQFYIKLNAIKDSKRKTEGVQLMSNLVRKRKKQYFDDFVRSQKERERNKREYKCLLQGSLKLNVAVLRLSFNRIKNYANNKNSNSLNIQPNQLNQDNKAKSKNLEAEQKNNKSNIKQPNPQNGIPNRYRAQQNLQRQNQNNTLNVNQPTQSLQNQPAQQSSPILSYTSQPVIQINQPLQSHNRHPNGPFQKQTGSNQISLISNQNPKQTKPIKEQNNDNSAGEYTSRQSNAPSVFGFQKSETSRPITKEQLYSLKDKPKFSFQIWQKQAIGFNRKKPAQLEKQDMSKILFNKPDSVRPANHQPQEQLNVDILIKQKVVVNPFFPYLMQHISASNEDEIQKIMSHQSGQLKQPLLKKYPLKDYAKAPTNTFNNILKIGKDKNTTRSVISMINDILKPARQSYSKSEKVATVFDGEPSLVTDYSWSHNIVKDEIFLQFIKQIMMNEKQESLKQLINSLQIITRYYYPSPQFIYAFLHYLKSLQSKNIQKLNECFTNILLFAQAFERYKGNSVTVLKHEAPPKQKESYNKLLMRATEITQQQVKGLGTLTLRLLNQQKFEYKVRNESLSLFKRKVLKVINLLHYQDYFGIYYCKTKGLGMILIPQTLKAIDFITKNTQNQTDNILYVKMNRYFPFSLKEINKTKMFYLNSLIEERYLPWKQQSYEGVVALSMLFDQFQEYRITNFVILTGQQTKQQVNFSKIEAKYNELSQQKGKKVNEYQYLKLVKENDFLAAKSYRIKEELQSPLNAVSKVLTKPLQLCFYQGNDLKSSVHLKRIKAYFFEKNQINLQIELSDDENQSHLRQLSLRGVEKAYEFYLDLSSYIEYLVDG